MRHTSKLLFVPPDRLAEMARSVVITNHETGMMSPWVPNQEQLQLWQDLYEHKYTYVLKVRQIGSSTACGWHAGVWVAVNDASGQFVRVGIVVDTDDKAKERLRVIHSQLEQLGLDCQITGGNRRIVFPGGSEIVAMTAGGRRAGASMTFNGFIFSELPFWRQCNAAYTSLMQALVQDGWAIVETTMGVEDPTAKDLWLKPNDFFKRFFSFEMHDEYIIRDPERVDELVTPETEQWLRSEGFTDRARMAYWVYLLRNRCGDDPVRCFREYPQLPEHSWRFSENRFISKTPDVLEPQKLLVPLPGGVAAVDMFETHSDEESYLIGVDTASGRGGDSSAVCVINHRTQALCASFRSNEVAIDDLVEVARYLQTKYTTTFTHPAYGERTVVPPLIIETNGIGQGTFQLAISAGLHCIDHVSTKTNGYQGMLAVKRMVEAGRLKGGVDLADECDQVHLENGRFKGKKDLLMSIAFCYHHIQQNPYHPLRLGLAPDTVDMSKRLRKFQAARFQRRL